MIGRWVRVLLFMSLSLNFAAAQLLVLEEGIEQVYQLESYSGDAMPNDLHDGKHALFFFSPTDCEACGLILDESSLFEVPGLTVTFVTDAVSADLEWLALERPELNIWIDARDLFSLEFSVTEIPVVFMVEDGVAVNADYWPFHNGLAGLINMLHMFSITALGPPGTEIVASLVGRDLSDLYLAHDLTGENLLMVCWDTCEVCDGAIQELSQWYVDNELLTALVPLVLNRGNPLGEQTNLAAKMLADWTSAGFQPVFENSEISESLVFDISPITLHVDGDGIVQGGIVGFSESFDESIKRLKGIDETL